jgi:hypothetical protein
MLRHILLQHEESQAAAPILFAVCERSVDIKFMPKVIQGRGTKKYSELVPVRENFRPCNWLIIIIV